MQILLIKELMTNYRTARKEINGLTPVDFLPEKLAGRVSRRESFEQFQKKFHRVWYLYTELCYLLMMMATEAFNRSGIVPLDGFKVVSAIIMHGKGNQKPNRR